MGRKLFIESLLLKHFAQDQVKGEWFSFDELRLAECRQLANKLVAANEAIDPELMIYEKEALLAKLCPPPRPRGRAKHSWGKLLGKLQEIKRMRQQGLTLQSIGDQFGVTREAIRQVLQ